MGIEGDYCRVEKTLKIFKKNQKVNMLMDWIIEIE